jgi:hypothetical protein
MKSTYEKEKELLKKIDKAKKDLVKLKEKRKSELGDIVIQSGLGDLDDKKLKSLLDTCFKELKNGNS